MNQKTLFFKQLGKTKPAVQTQEIKSQELLLEIHKGFFFFKVTSEMKLLFISVFYFY